MNNKLRVALTATAVAVVLAACGKKEEAQQTQQAAAAYAGDRYNADDDFDFVGTPALIIDQMRPFIALGVDTFMLDCGGFPDLTTLELLVSEVLPALNA